MKKARKKKNQPNNGYHAYLMIVYFTFNDQTVDKQRLKI